MWNASFQGKKSGGTHDGHGGNAGPPPASTGNPTATMTDATATFSTVTGGSSNNSGGVGGDGVPPTIKSANDNNDKSPPPSLPVPSKKKLTAILWPHGNKVTVRVVVNNQIVSAPSSGSSNSSSGAGGAVAEDNEDGTGGGAVKKMMMMRQQQQQHHQDNNAHTNHTTVGSGFDNRGYSGANTTTKTDMSPNNKNSTMMMDQDGMLQQQQQHGNKSFNKQTTEDSMNSTIGSDVDEDDNNNKHHTRRGNDQQQQHCDNNNSINNMAGSSENSSSTSDAVPSSQMPSSATGLNNGSDAGGGGGGSSSNFEASLLLGIAESTSASSNTNNSNASGIAGVLGTEKEKREPVDPTTLPTSMTSFLDMLTEDQRRVRHRHIPGVDGFRKLYRSEVKSDMSEARKMKRSVVRHHKVQVEVKDTTSGGGGGGGSDNGGASAMEVEGENEENKNNSGSAGGATGMSDTTNGKDNGGEKEDETPPPAMRDAFVVPGREVRMCALGGQLAGMIESTDFEFAIKGSNGTTTAATNANNNPLSSSSSNNNNNPKDTLRSPRLVDSLTSFNPPRPQESTSSKTKHRLKRWEANPHEVESDLANYRKTVARTREELHNANREHAMIEAGASMMRGHFMEHLMEYRREMTVLRDQMASVTGNCLKLGEEYNVSGGSVSTRGTVKGMKDVLITLKALGEDIKGGVDGSSSEDGSKRGVADVTAAGGSEVPHDWRVEGVGGVRASRALCVALKPSYQEGAKKAASGWLLPGDDVVIVNSGMEGKIAYIHGPEEAMKRSEDAKKKMGKNKMKESAAVKYNDAMDVDTPNKEKKGGMPSTTAANKENSSSKLYTTIGVKLGKSGQFRNYHPSQVRLNVKKFPTMTHTDASLVKRWEDMIKTALPNGVDHDVLAMEHYINSSLVKERNAEEDAAAIADNGTKDNNDGSGSPKSVTQCGDDDRMLLPFGAGLIAAPQDVKNYPSLIPLDTLEESVRKVVYEADKSRVIPTMSSNRSVRKFEAQQEEMNRLKGKAMQLRNRLGRQKRLRSLNERSLMAGQSRANKVEGLLLEMQMDLKNLKERLQDELNEIGIGDSSAPTDTPLNDADNGTGTFNDGAPKKEDGAPANMTATVDKAGTVSVDAKEGAGDAHISENSMLESKEEVASNHPGVNEGVDNELDRELKRARVEEV